MSLKFFILPKLSNLLHEVNNILHHNLPCLIAIAFSTVCPPSFLIHLTVLFTLFL